MNNERSFQKLAGVTAIISAPLAMASIVMVLMPVNYNFEAFEKLNLFLSAGTNSAAILRWSMVLDVYGSYLLLTPAAFFLWHWLKLKGEIQAGFYTFCGLAYILLGALGATILSVAWPALVTEYAQASGEYARTLEVVFGTVTNMVNEIWNSLNPIASGIWWLGIGSLLRSQRRNLGIFTVILGIDQLLHGAGAILGIAFLATITQSLIFLLLPIWAFWLGLDLLRKPVQLTD